jgi:spermidine synthase
MDWLDEPVGPHARHGLAVRAIVCDERSEVQHIQIFDTVGLGRVLVLDGRIQTSELDRATYHEALAQPAALAGPCRSALILGGGPGATLAEVLRHRSIERVVMVEIDRRLIELCREHLPAHSAGAFDDPRLDLVVGDALAWLGACRETFDLVIADLTAPLDGSPSERAWSTAVFAAAAARVGERGRMVTHCGPVSVDGRPWSRQTVAMVAGALPTVATYLAHVPCFGSGNPWTFVVGSRGTDPSALPPAAVDAAIASAGIRLETWDGETHRHAFALPKTTRRALGVRA